MIIIDSSSWSSKLGPTLNSHLPGGLVAIDLTGHTTWFTQKNDHMEPLKRRYIARGTPAPSPNGAPLALPSSAMTSILQVDRAALEPTPDSAR